MTVAAEARPRLSIVVAAWHGAAELARCLAALDAAGAADDSEIIVARNWEGAEAAALAARYPRVVHVALADATVPRLRAAGLARARGDVIAFLEDHAAVVPGWARAVIRAHGQGHAAVGGPVANAPGSSALDWAAYFYDYGRYAPPCGPAVATQLSGINSSYRRDSLEALGNAIGEGIHEDRLQAALQARGETFFLDPDAAVVQHGHHTAVGATTQAFHLARGFAARRAAGTSVLARTVRTVGSAMLPAVMLWRVSRRALVAPGLRLRLFRALPWLAVLVASWSLGEAMGYAVGAGRSEEHWR